jgi:hypothetical protein
VTGGSRFDGKDGGERIGRNGRALASGTAMSGVGAPASSMSGFRVAG